MKEKATILNNKVYLCGKEITGKTKIYYACQKVFGIGPARAQYICDWLKNKYMIEQTTAIGNLSDEEIQSLNNFITENWKIEADLKKQIDQNIDIKVRIQSREGKRLKLGLPLHGRTRSNAQTAKRRKKL